MKPLSEELKEISENIASHGCEVCGECHVEETFTRELQAWLREADNGEPPTWFVDELYRLFPEDRQLFTVGNALWRKVRRELLGTTQKGKQEGEK